MASQLWKNLARDFKAQRWEGVIANYEELKKDFLALGSMPLVYVDGIVLDQAASDGAAFAAAQDMAIRARRQLQLA